MADHLRDQILAAMATTLTGLTTTGANVFQDRAEDDEPLQKTQLPALVINQGGSESIEPISQSFPRTLQAVFEIDVNAYVMRTDALGDRRKLCNTIAKEVQTAVGNNPRMSNLCGQVTLVQTDFDLTGEAEKPAAMVRLRYQAVYFCKENAADTVG